MLKKVVVAGLLGGIVLILWTFVVHGVLGFKSSIDMRQVPNERLVYETLKENIVEPGRYACNPEVTPTGFPGEEPVFSISYSGMGHEAAGMLVVVGLIVFLFAPMIGAWMLSQTSEQVMSSYSRKVLFFAVIGLLFAVFGDVLDYGIGGYPGRDTILLAVHNIAQWTVVGLVVAWRIRPMSVDTKPS